MQPRMNARSLKGLAIQGQFFHSIRKRTHLFVEAVALSELSTRHGALSFSSFPALLCAPDHESERRPNDGSREGPASRLKPVKCHGTLFSGWLKRTRRISLAHCGAETKRDH